MNVDSLFLMFFLPSDFEYKYNKIQITLIVVVTFMLSISLTSNLWWSSIFLQNVKMQKTINRVTQTQQGNQIVPINHLSLVVPVCTQKPLKKLCFYVSAFLQRTCAFLNSSGFTKKQPTNRNEELSCVSRRAVRGEKQPTLPRNSPAGPVELAASQGCWSIIFSFTLQFPF